MKGSGDDTWAAQPPGDAQALRIERVASRAAPPIMAEHRAERLARMAALAQAIRADAARLFPDQAPDLRSMFLN